MSSLGLLTVAVSWASLQQWAALSLADRRYSHLTVIPVIAAGMLYLERRKVFTATRVSLGQGLLLLASFAPHLLIRARVATLAPDLQLSAEILTILPLLASAFALCYGVDALRAARFPFLLLLLMVPVPFSAMDGIISVLQHGSAETTYALFNLIGTPCFRNGVRFELPGIGIEIAKECSSIHSAVALFITSLLLGHVILRSAYGKLCLSLLSVPIAMFTNSIRIVMLWFLGTKVDPGFLSGSLHQRGGVLFSVISLSLIIAVLALLRKLESSTGKAITPA